MEFSKVKKAILGTGIAIILALFIGYGISTFYDKPEYSGFCEEKFAVPRSIIKEDVDCEEVEVSEAEKQACREKQGDIIYEYDSKGCITSYECSTCRYEYDSARESHDRVVFIISGILGLISILVGAVALKIDTVSPGIMAGGVLTVIYGTLRYWGHMQDVLRFIILGIVLVVLIWIGYKKLK